MSGILIALSHAAPPLSVAEHARRKQKADCVRMQTATGEVKAQLDNVYCLTTEWFQPRNKINKYRKNWSGAVPTSDLDPWGNSHVRCDAV